MIDGGQKPGKFVCFYSKTDNSCRLAILRLIFSSPCNFYFCDKGYHYSSLHLKGMIGVLTQCLKVKDRCRIGMCILSDNFNEFISSVTLAFIF